MVTLYLCLLSAAAFAWIFVVPAAAAARDARRDPLDKGRSWLFRQVRVRFAVFTLIAFGVGWSVGFRPNTTGSLPGWVFLMTPPVLAHDAMVLACIPRAKVLAAGYLGEIGYSASCGRDAAHGKLVLALPGDLVEVTEEGFRRNGVLIRNTALRREDFAGNELFPVDPGVYRAEGVWLYAPHPRSFDSRFYAEIDPDRIVSGLVRVL